MIVLTDTLSNKVDEGYAKIAYSLAKRLKSETDTLVDFSTDKNTIADISMKCSKLFFSKKLKKICNNQNILYIPKASNSRGTILRLISLKSYIHAKKITVLFSQFQKMSKFEGRLLKSLNVNIFVLSEKSKLRFLKYDINATVLKLGVDTHKFLPVSSEEKLNLRKKYGFSQDDKILLHVGHLKYGRNIIPFSQLDGYKKILVASPSTVADEGIFERIETNSDLYILNHYIESIEEIYQIADCYVFLVEDEQNCIDIPLSVLEACSCNLPIVSTSYGDMLKFENDGFKILRNIDLSSIRIALKEALSCKKIENRNLIIEFDWNNRIDMLKRSVEGESR